MTASNTSGRRTFLKNSAVAAAVTALPAINFAQSAAPAASADRQFSPQTGNWRTFEVTTRVDIVKPQGATRVWLPIPSVNTDWQKSLESSFSSNGQTKMTDDDKYGARMLYVEFAENQAQPFVELTSRIQTQNRAANWANKQATAEDAASLKFWTQPTSLLPTDGIVRTTALEATKGASTDAEKPRSCMTGLWPTPSANPRSRVAARAISKPCWKPAIWAASAPT